MSENRYWQMVRNLIEDGQGHNRPKHEIREQIVEMVHMERAEGAPWADEVLSRWEASGADIDYTKVYKDQNTVTYVRADGRRVRKTVAYSRPLRSAASGQIVGRQLQAWWGMSRIAVAALREELAEQGSSIAEVVTALDRLADAMDRHPECATAAEAWLADGHELDEIDLRDVAA